MLGWLRKLFEGKGTLFVRGGQKHAAPEPVARKLQLHKDHPQRALRPRRITLVMSPDEAREKYGRKLQGQREPGPRGKPGPDGAA
jgi:hypothetical protein